MNGPSGLGSRIVRWVLRLLPKPLFRVQITGDPQQFNNERTLIVANHESFLRRHAAVTASPAFVHAASSRTDAAKGEALVLFTTDRTLKREAASNLQPSHKGIDS